MDLKEAIAEDRIEDWLARSGYPWEPVDDQTPAGQKLICWRADLGVYVANLTADAGWIAGGVRTDGRGGEAYQPSPSDVADATPSHWMLPPPPPFTKESAGWMPGGGQ